jgi:hypothetical protein
MVFAATNVDKCTEKFEACKVTCGNLRSQCLARGSDAGACDYRLKACNMDCAKDLKACQAKSQTKSPTPGPGKSPTKK